MFAAMMCLSKYRDAIRDFSSCSTPNTGKLDCTAPDPIALYKKEITS
jgi:hypothetical protein